MKKYDVQHEEWDKLNFSTVFGMYWPFWRKSYVYLHLQWISWVVIHRHPLHASAFAQTWWWARVICHRRRHSLIASALRRLESIIMTLDKANQWGGNYILQQLMAGTTYRALHSKLCIWIDIILIVIILNTVR